MLIVTCILFNQFLQNDLHRGGGGVKNLKCDVLERGYCICDVCVTGGEGVRILVF